MGGKMLNSAVWLLFAAGCPLANGARPVSTSTTSSLSSLISGSSTSTSSSGVGNYIASGFGVPSVISSSVTSQTGTGGSAAAASISSGRFINSTTSSSNTSSTISSTGTSSSNKKSSLAGGSASITGNRTSTSGLRPAFSGINTSSFSNSTSKSGNGTSVSGNSTSALGNGTVNPCFASYSSWWSAGNTAVVVTLTATSTFGAAFTTTVTYGETVVAGTYTTEGVTTVTYPVVDDGYTIGSITTTYTSLSPTVVTVPADQATTYADTETFTGQMGYTYNVFSTVPYSNVSGAPQCQLPTYAPQCQQSWTSYISAQLVPPPTISTTCPSQPATAPLNACQSSVDSVQSSYRSSLRSATSPQCQQASITGSLCQSIRDEYVIGTAHAFEASGYGGIGAFLSNGYIGTTQGTNTYYIWPTSNVFAPGCTLGCGRCAVTGGSVQLLFWPPMTSTPSGSGPIVASYGGTTLTYPTNYISYASLYASDACNAVGGTHYNTILPVPSQTPLSSLYAVPAPTDGANIIPTISPAVYATASFNYNDLLVTPVPYSIYSSQPWCASYMFFEHVSYMTSGVQCPTVRPYEPILVLPSAFYQSIDPAWSTCSADLRGLYDPPMPLTPVAAVASATAPGSPTSQSATPGNPVPHSSTPIVTPQPIQSPTSGNSNPSGDPGRSSSPGASVPGPSSSPGASAPGPKPTNGGSSGDPGASIGSGIASILGGGGGSSASAPAPRPSNGGSSGDPGASRGSGVPGATASRPAPGSTPIVVGGQTITAPAGTNPSSVVIGGTTLSVGGPGATISGTPVTVGPSGIIIGSGTAASTVPIGPSRSGSASNAGAATGVTFTGTDGKTFTGIQTIVGPSGTEVIIGSATLSVGGKGTTIDGVSVSLASGSLVVGSQTDPLSKISGTASSSGSGGGSGSPFSGSASATLQHSVQAFGGCVAAVLVLLALQ